MEWNAHLTSLQGALISLDKIAGPFIKIKYKGGNEDKISKVVQVIQKHLTSKNSKLNVKIDESQNVTLFLLLNSEFESNNLLDIKEFLHFRKVTPPLSKCLLANIITELDLVLCYSRIITKLPIRVNIEVLDELVMCVKYSRPESAVEHTYLLITEIITVLCSLQDQEMIDKLLDFTSEMLKSISVVNTDYLSNKKQEELYRHMGITLMYLLRLLKQCRIHSSNLSKLLDDLIRVTITLLNAVSINVFCIWAEVEHEEQPLQIIIASEAYLVIEHLKKFKPAVDLIQMLGSIAKKPKTLEETINESAISTMIDKINKCDGDQRLWFQSLVNNNPLQNQQALDCLNQWSHLCNKDDVTVILNWSVSHRNPSVKEIVLKCAGNLSIEDLSAVSVRYRIEKNTNNLNIGTINDRLKLLLNKLENNTQVDNYFIKEVHLMLLQNPEEVMIRLFEKCTTNVGIATCLRATFTSIKDVVKINDTGTSALLQVLHSHPPSFENQRCYVELLNELLVSYFNECAVISGLFMQIMKNLSEDDATTLLYVLQIFNDINLQYKLQDETRPILGILLHIMEKNRCHLLTFETLQQQIVHLCVSILLKYNNSSNMEEIKKDFVEDIEITNNLNKFYVANLQSTLGNNLLEYIYPSCNIYNVVGLLEMALPSCVEQEWIYITNELETKFGYKTTYELLTNVLTLFCQLVDAHDGDSRIHLRTGLKYCLEMYGIIIKSVFRQRHTTQQDEIFLTKTVCKLLLVIPQDIRRNEGLGLVHLLTTESLQALKNDRMFIFLLVSMKDALVSEMLVKRIMS